jgi:PAS domain S-box-containing protein
MKKALCGHPDIEVEDLVARVKQTEQLLTQIEEKFQSILANSVDVLYRRNLQTDRYDCVSPSVQVLTGYSPEEFMSGGLQTTINRIHPDDVERSKHAVEDVLSSVSGTGGAEYRYLRKDNVYRWFSDHYTVIRDPEGNPLYWTGTVRDITDLKNAEEALKKSHDFLEAKVVERTSQLREMMLKMMRAEESEQDRIANILHEDLQQILVGLRYMIHAPRTGELNRERTELASRILDEAINVTRSLSAQMIKPLLIEEKLGEGLAWLTSDAQQRFGLTVELSMDSAAEPESEALRMFVFHSVRELILNIVKHAGTKQARLNITLSDNEWIRIEISDPGVGFEAEAKLLDGFGLFRIRERAAFFGGTLQTTSSPGGGCSVTLTLPKC